MATSRGGLLHWGRGRSRATLRGELARQRRCKRPRFFASLNWPLRPRCILEQGPTDPACL
eukprot:5464541-Pyramimonas_sp.AAC.1